MIRVLYARSINLPANFHASPRELCLYLTSIIRGWIYSPRALTNRLSSPNSIKEPPSTVDLSHPNSQSAHPAAKSSIRHAHAHPQIDPSHPSQIPPLHIPRIPQRLSFPLLSINLPTRILRIRYRIGKKLASCSQQYAD